MSEMQQRLAEILNSSNETSGDNDNEMELIFLFVFEDMIKLFQTFLNVTLSIPRNICNLLSCI